VNPGGEPERDDTGLPPVDIEIPDDARELDRDVQAYHREQRALRRQQRGLRVRGSLAKDGIILPLLACFLILASITGTLLTVFTATSDQNLSGPSGYGQQQTSRPPPTSRSAATPQPTTAPGVLPRATIAVDGHAPTPVQALSQAALLLIPSHCNCNATIHWLIYVVTGAHAQPYLVYTASTKADVQRLYDSLSRSDRAQVLLAADPGNLLREAVASTLPGTGVDAVIIGPRKGVLYATALRAADVPTALIKALTH